VASNETVVRPRRRGERAMRAVTVLAKPSRCGFTRASNALGECAAWRIRFDGQQVVEILKVVIGSSIPRTPLFVTGKT
jgi:hypothetical protein